MERLENYYFYGALIMKTFIPLEFINPAIRYVNHIHFPEEYTVAKRILYDHEFLYCLDGQAKMEYQNQTFLIQKGDLFHIEPFMENRMFVEKNHSFSAHCVHFDFMKLDSKWDFSATWAYFIHPLTPKEIQRMEELTHRPNPVPKDFFFPPLLCNLNRSVMAPLFRELYRTYGRIHRGDSLKLKAVFLQILSQIYFELDSQDTKNSFDHIAYEAIYYMKEHFSSPITAVSLAQRFDLSPKYFGSLFKKSTGMTIQEKLLSIRMEHASQLLIYTGYPIEEIAERVGISDVFYFTKLFKREKGLPPGQYRRQFR